MLVQACLIVGDETALAQALNVPLPSLIEWLLGETPVPNDVFLKAIDITLEATGKQVAVTRKLLDQLKTQVQKRHRS